MLFNTDDYIVCKKPKRYPYNSTSAFASFRKSCLFIEMHNLHQRRQKVAELLR
jgi:hypothetical protein